MSNGNTASGSSRFNGRPPSSMWTPSYHLELERDDIAVKVLWLESSILHASGRLSDVEIERRKRQITSMKDYVQVLEGRIKAVQETLESSAADGYQDSYQDRLIDAAETYAARYKDDDRPDIRTDVLNAFYAGSATAPLLRLQDVDQPPPVSAAAATETPQATNNLVTEGLLYFERIGDAGDRLYVNAIRAEINRLRERLGLSVSLLGL